MKGLFIELTCPNHGLERFTIKVKRRCNIPANEIKPLFRSRPVYELSCLLIGRSVEEAQIQDYIIKYLRQKNLYERLVNFKLV